MILPDVHGLVGACFVIDGPFGKTVQTFTGTREVRGEFRLCFAGWDNEEKTETRWEPKPEFLKSAQLVSLPRPS